VWRQIRPPIAFPPDSKRAEIIEDAENNLEEDMDEVKDAVHAYNVDFQRRIVRSPAPQGVLGDGGV